MLPIPNSTLLTSLDISHITIVTSEVTDISVLAFSAAVARSRPVHQRSPPVPTLPAPAHRTHDCPLTNAQRSHLCAVLPDARSTSACRAPPWHRRAAAAVRCMTGARRRSRQLAPCLSLYLTETQARDRAQRLNTSKCRPCVAGGTRRERADIFLLVAAPPSPPSPPSPPQRAVLRHCQASRSCCCESQPPRRLCRAAAAP